MGHRERLPSPAGLRRSQTSRHATRARTRIGASCHHWRDRGGHRLGCRGVVDTPKANPQRHRVSLMSTAQEKELRSGDATDFTNPFYRGLHQPF